MNPWLKIGTLVSVDYVPYEWADYFRNYQSRNQIYCDVKQIISLRLHNEGKTREWIGAFLGVDHSSVTHFINTRKPTLDYKAVKECYVDWIMRGVYPVGLTPKQRYNYKPLDGFRTMFKLQEL